MALEIHRRSPRHREAFLKCNCVNATLDSLPTALPVADNHLRGRIARACRERHRFSKRNWSTRSRQSESLAELAARWRSHARPDVTLGARVISATTQNLDEELRRGRFREDLYYRINGVCLRLPSLRDRRDDIPVLLAFFLKKYAALLERQEPELEPRTMDLLLHHSWPGNVRELENMARKIVALGDEHLAIGDLAARPATMVSLPAEPAIPAPGVQSLKEAAREASRKAERELIAKALERTHWNRKRTARELQISYKALLYKLKQLNLDGVSDS